MLSKLQTALDQHVVNTAQDRTQIDSIEKENIQVKRYFTRLQRQHSLRTDTRKRLQEGEGLDGQSPLKKGIDSTPGAENCLPAFVTIRRASQQKRVKGGHRSERRRATEETRGDLFCKEPIAGDRVESIMQR